ncbi:YegS/Rv2252/BmrU family lipid kinase [Wukongibacter sp. M2B1]|uniref:YegS/Rv2252/BmrU family lipid kinase n=1 Tax=Wukongibacter sp. M2B1 TaxID=3088895 RepID=UPI003D78B370
MKVLLIYNPVSGSGIFKNYLDYIIEKFQEKDFQIIPYRISSKDTLDNILLNLDENEYKKILIAGGDGTINRIVNKLVKYDINLPIGIFPVGTANDYAQYFNLPRTIEEMTDIVLRDNYTYCDIGIANDKYFINVASLGFLIDISQKTDTKFKNNLGVLAYYLKGIEELPNLKAINVKVTAKEIDFNDEIYFMLIMNGKSAGGFKKIAPLSSLSDGLLDVFIFKKCPSIELVPLMLKVVNGEHFNSPHVIYFQTDELIVDCDRQVGTDLDGEKGSNFPLNIKVVPQKLKINTRANNEDGFSPERAFSFYDVKNACEQISKGVIKELKRPLSEMSNTRNTAKDLKNLITDLPRHNTFNYVNKRSLNEEYFKEAEKTLDNGYMYIVLSSTGSAAGKLIGKVTKKEYAHASISFDEDLKTIISYNGGENIYSPGLNQEMIEFFNKKPDANIMVYRIQAGRKQKEKILEEIKKINNQGSSYNILGLFLPYSHKSNIMFCSQFVYTMLKLGGLDYFDKKPEEVRPTDFVELDYERRLEYCTKIFVNDML